MSEFSPLLLLNLLQNNIQSKKIKVQLYEYLINEFNKDSNISNEYSQIYNNLKENRIELVKEEETDFYYI